MRSRAQRDLIAGGYGAWLIIPFVVGADLTPSIKTALTTVLGATPLLTKLLAITLFGRPTINFLKRHSFKLFRNDSGALSLADKRERMRFLEVWASALSRRGGSTSDLSWPSAPETSLQTMG